jgi:hypothetical protein
MEIKGTGHKAVIARVNPISLGNLDSMRRKIGIQRPNDWAQIIFQNKILKVHTRLEDERRTAIVLSLLVVAVDLVSVNSRTCWCREGARDRCGCSAWSLGCGSCDWCPTPFCAFHRTVVLHAGARLLHLRSRAVPDHTGLRGSHPRSGGGIVTETPP